MHSSLILVTILVALLWRWTWAVNRGRSLNLSWHDRWESALSSFCLPPLIILLAAGAVLSMGHHGTMLGWSVSPVGCWVSMGLLVFFSGSVVYALGRSAIIGLRLGQYPQITLPQGQQARCLPGDLPVAAQVGLWRSSLLVSQGWLEQLTPSEQGATLAHEQAHADHHDLFWFFWLGIIHRFAFWLPGNSALWEELLLLREIRADQQAAQTSDPLLLAELLVRLARQRNLPTQTSAEAHACEVGIGFNECLSISRLEQRINALIEPGGWAETKASGWGRLSWLLVVGLPLATTWLHT